ncbi:pseudouridylate synthase-like protein [Leishmania mexicana MHOM/GT/2001/U1103]|uniref:Pseudouridylate synthase RPUSD4, mitochondrial n=1 Tax=Leishmania mexicana (strain MHOM/GT/2001/U1103) TaxID=929439 RepID=E9AJB4_LEIMU|nr:pseudouridylate synthase-like protein [Leishmania mexicana MHOM/GT/2001/U1103]CBZ23011.1 pseudouridylate synthase-like protein [Leishmania mexicana MHOM/GT/2001/U1103]
MRRHFLLLAWQPSFVKHLPELEPVPQRAPVEKRRRQHIPLSLQAREELSRKSKELQYHVVTQDWFGQRVDDFVTQHHPEWDYETVKRLVQQGHIYRYRKNGKKRYTRLTDRLEFDELVVVPTASFWERQLAPPSGVELQSSSTSQRQQERRQTFHLSAKAREMAQEMVLFKNEHVVVINKPSGVPIMPTHDPLAMNITDLLPAWRYTNTQKPIICHNLDTETSGCVVLARSSNAHRMLGRMFVKRVVPNSVYWGFAVGKPPVNFGRIRMHFEVQKGQGGDVIVARPTPTADSKVGIAEFVVNASALEFGSFISFYPLTTRRHQERIMAAHALRAPLLGDAKYGGESAFPHSLSLFWDPARKDVPLHLHHRKIQLPYKNGAGEFVCVTAPLPPHMEKTFKRLGWPVDADDPLIPG